MKIMLLLLCLLQNTHILIAESQKQTLFKKFFNSDQIDPRLCAENIFHLLRLWDNSEIDLTEVEVWSISNKGNSYFGLLKYYQNRFVGFQHFPYPENPDYHSNSGGGGWYYHVIVVSDGVVYDTSYKPVPTLLPLKFYILDMFSLQTDIGKAFYERKKYGLKAINDYSVVTYDAYDYLKAKIEKERLADYKKNERMLNEVIDLNVTHLNHPERDLS